MPPIRISAQLQPQHSDWPAMRRAWQDAEALGADCLFNWDHFFPLRGEPHGKHFEALTVLGAMAEVTERVELGSLVICNSYRNPDYLADAHRTIDHISGGRAILGIGAGWFEKDYDEYGYDFGTPGSRLELLKENLARISARLPKLEPRPTRDLPILIGGGGEKKTLRLVAQYADMWHTFADLDVLAHKNKVLAEHCAAVGTDQARIERSVQWPGLAKAPAFVEAGVTTFTIGVSGPDYDLSEVATAVRWRDEVNPEPVSGLA